MLPPAQLATLACLLEVAAPKPGNVHRGADFEDVGLNDFLISAAVLGESLRATTGQGLGTTVRRAVTENRVRVGSNTNLGMILLLSPLVRVAELQPVGPAGAPLPLTNADVQHYLESVDPAESELLLRAIAEAKPGGLGEAETHDVRSLSGPVPLLEAMQAGRSRDAIARQYVTGFRDLFEVGTSWLLAGRDLFDGLSQAIVFAHVCRMAHEPDSLIGRKCGPVIARESQTRAARARDALLTDGLQQAMMVRPLTRAESRGVTDAMRETYWSLIGDLDFWLRSDGHRRNPGTSADLTAATLWLALYNQELSLPLRCGGED